MSLILINLQADREVNDVFSHEEQRSWTQSS
jgi:hypothetical protein